MSTVYETQPHFVAYLDLLAGKHLIKAEEDESLNRMHSLLQVAKDSGAHSANAIFPKCKIKIFSDNIIIACRLTGDPAKDYSRILSAFMLVSAIQIVGLEITITRLEGKFKLSQNKDEADRLGAAEHVAQRGHADLAERMRGR